MKKWYGALALVSFILLLGTVGAMEHERIPLWQGIVQSVLWLACFGYAVFLIAREERK